MIPKKILLLFPLLFVVSSCSDDTSLLDPTAPDSYPLFQSIALSAYAFDTDSISAGSGTRSPDDPIEIVFRLDAKFQNSSKAAIKEAYCTVRLDGRSTVITKKKLQLSTNPNSASENIPLNIRRGDVGDYSVEVTGTDSRDLALNSVRTKLNLINGSNPPVMSDLSAPDSLTLPAQGVLLLTMTVRVKDPSGLKDVKRVWFSSYLPNGTPSSGNPFLMYDDATNGDGIDGDGIYSRTVQLPSTAVVGKYRFEFQAFDFGNLPSNVIVHYIVVQ